MGEHRQKIILASIGFAYLRQQPRILESDQCARRQRLVPTSPVEKPASAYFAAQGTPVACRRVRRSGGKPGSLNRIDGEARIDDFVDRGVVCRIGDAMSQHPICRTEFIGAVRFVCRNGFVASIIVRSLGSSLIQ